MYDEPEDIVDQLAVQETMLLLRMLALNFSGKTKRLLVPRGTRVWRAEEKYGPHPENVRPVIIPLIPFFGMYVGYNQELDLLVCWKV